MKLAHFFIAALLTIGVTLATVLVFQTDKDPDEPPHATRRDGAEVGGPGGPKPGSSIEGVGDAVTQAVAYVEGVRRAEHTRALKFAAAVEEQAERARPVRSLSGSTAAASSTSGCVLPDYICQRESGGDYGAVNPTGCSGRGCYGRYQFDPRTWDGAGCEGTAQTATPEQQDACATRVWDGGNGASHWAATG
jgi:hypothetical protein